MAGLNPSRVLGLGLLALAGLYVAWFHADADAVAALLVFALPPLLLAVPAWRGGRRARFWAGVLALFWFSHGVMTVWAHPEDALPAWLETILALLVILSSSWQGLRARLGKRGG
jgi:uncharacterized membrane protein